VAGTVHRREPELRCKVSQICKYMKEQDGPSAASNEQNGSGGRDDKLQGAMDPCLNTVFTELHGDELRTNTMAPRTRPVEIERRWLVPELPPLGDAGVRIVQGYLALDADGTEVRLRSKANHYYLTTKQGDGLERSELECEVPQAVFDAHWPAAERRSLTKHRHTLAYAGHTIELDRYEGHLAPLMIAEVEFRSMEAAIAFVPPTWFGTEVTDDVRYRNRSLVQRQR
jgi:adenylate cyclase